MIIFRETSLYAAEAGCHPSESTENCRAIRPLNCQQPPLNAFHNASQAQGIEGVSIALASFIGEEALARLEALPDFHD